MNEETTIDQPEGEVLPEDAVQAEQEADSTPAEKQQEDEHKPEKWQRRIDRLTAQKYQERARADMLEQRLNQIEQRLQQPQKPASDDAPDMSKFDDLQGGIDARAEWVAQREAAKAVEELGKRWSQAQQEQAAKQVQQAFASRVKAFAEQVPDFEEVIDAGDFVPTQAMQHAIFESDLGPRIAYYLAQHSDEAQRIVGMSPTAAIRAIGRIEAKLESNPIAKPVSKAPKPTEPVEGKGAASKDPDKMPADEWREWREAQLRKK